MLFTLDDSIVVDYLRVEYLLSQLRTLTVWKWDDEPHVPRTALIDPAAYGTPHLAREMHGAVAYQAA
jgi:hypothetical protein